MSSVASIRNLPVPVVTRRPDADSRAPEQHVAPIKPIAAIARLHHPREDINPRQPELQSDRGRSGRRPNGWALTSERAEAETAPPRAGAPSIQFTVQLLGQQAGTLRAPRHLPGALDLTQHRDGAALGSEIYRRAGGEPREFSSEATIFRIAV